MVGYNPEPINGKELSSAEYSEAGLVSGVATRVIIQPLDVLKIRFQLQEEPIRGKSAGKYKGVLQSIGLISREEGLRAFWKGHIPAQGLSAVYGLVQFSAFEFLSRQAGRLLPRCPPIVRSSSDFVCGGLSGCMAMTAAMPLDVIRTRLVAQTHAQGVIYNGTSHAMLYIWKKEGWKGYFRGWVPSVVQIAPFTGIQFALYNVFTDLWQKFVSIDHDTSGALLCGAMAGTMSKTVLYPLDMVRHRLQMNGFQRKGFGKTSAYDRGMMRTIAMVVRSETIYGLFKITGSFSTITHFLCMINTCIVLCGLIVSVQAACFTCSKLLFGVISDRHCAVRILSISLLGTVFATISLAFASSLSHLLVNALLIGSLQGAGWTPAVKVLKRLYGSSASYSRRFAMLGCGSTIAGLSMPLLATFYWRTAVLDMALIGIVFVTVFYFVLKNDKSLATTKGMNVLSMIREVVYEKVIWYISFNYLFCLQIRSVCETWIPLYLTENGISFASFQISYEMGGLLGTVVSGYVIDYLTQVTQNVDRARRILTVVSSFSMIFCMIFIIQIPSIMSLMGFLTGCSVCASVNGWCLIASEAGPSHISGSCAAFVSFIANMGVVLCGSPLASLIARFGFGTLVPLFSVELLVFLGLATLNYPIRFETKKSDQKVE